MGERRVVVGVDGGGTKTHAVVVTTAGEVLAEATGPSSNLQVLGAQGMAEAVASCVRSALRKVDLPVDVLRLFAGLAGAGRASDKERAEEALSRQGIARACVVDSDAMAALSGAFAGGEGIILIAGTGTICFGRGADGSLARSGGWGYLLGDEGSGYFVGQQALVAALKDLDGRGKPTALRRAIEARYGVTRIDELIPKIYGGEIDRSEIAALAPLVFETAEAGDEVARHIVARAGEELGQLVAAVARRLPWSREPIQVALIGGLFERRDVLLPHMRRGLPQDRQVEFVEPMFDPAVGAAILAMQAEGIEVDREVRERLRQSLQRLRA